MDQICTQEWLSQSPSFTSFRVNKLKEFDTKSLEDYLYKQSLDLNVNTIPKFYFLAPDCIIIEQWPYEVSMEKCENEVIVDAECAAAVLRGAHVYAPGVMGLPPNVVVNERIDIYGDIEGKCKRGLKVKYEGRKQYVGTGYLKMLRKDLFENHVQPSGIAIHTILPESKLAVVNETLCPKGVILLQNLPSIVCGWVVNAKQDEYILDMCSAPGNKTTHLAEMSSNKAFITAIDKTPKKVQRIRENCENHGVISVKAFVYDSTKCCSETSTRLYEPPFAPNSFDKVLLDAPCSGLGQRPRLTNKITPHMLQSYQYLQRKLFYQAAEVLKRGGKLVYSTCTINKDENEGIVSWALKNIPCLKLVPAEPLVGGPGLPNVGLTDEERIMVQRFGPEIDRLRQVEDIYRNGIGFFIASFTKI